MDDGEADGCPADGVLYTMGRNDSGCLGHGDKAERTRPSKVMELQYVPIVQVAARGGAHQFLMSQVAAGLRHSVVLSGVPRRTRNFSSP